MFKRSLALATVLGAFVSISGCYTPGGGIIPNSYGSQTYFSKETRPATVELVDTRNQEVVFRMEIPPGKQLVVDFVAGGGDDPVYTPDLMRYQVMDIGTQTGRLRSSMTVPSQWSRRVDIYYREGAEYKPQPQDNALRTDQLEDRPSWWTPEGGEMPEDPKGLSNYGG